MNLDPLTPYFTLGNLAATVISALAAAFSGWAAWRSAGSARKAESRADEAEFRMAFKDVALVATECSVVRSRVRSLVPELIGALKASQITRGIRSDSYTDIATKMANAKLVQVEQFTEGLDCFLPANLTRKVTTAAEAHKEQIRWGAALVELRAIEQGLAADLDKVRQVTADAVKVRPS